MKAKEALHEISTMVFRNTDNFEMRISKGCYKNLVNALEKQIPKPKYYQYEQNVKDTQMLTVCPECKLCTITNINYKPKYCCWCGQALEWNEKGGAE